MPKLVGYLLTDNTFAEPQEWFVCVSCYTQDETPKEEVYASPSDEFFYYCVLCHKQAIPEA